MWVLWPTLNTVWTLDKFQASINTVLSLIGSGLATFVVSSIVGNKLEVEHVQNATLSGGVVMATGASLHMSPGCALFIGVIAGVISTIAFQFVSPLVERYLGVSDTRGVLNLHGIPGFISGIVATLIMLLNHKQNRELLDSYKARCGSR
eukprot:TRINITY_DN5322_c0_g1_i4.p1 TRINITY_DN5322_c0_g1~~TRINITY_DN5322_c0_g1_i4.p1  ORF type:complete len:149 (-),score=0.96 TRINITY_DN5322_c0_g1_i4:805-1251(-)